MSIYQTYPKRTLHLHLRKDWTLRAFKDYGIEVVYISNLS